MTTLPIQVFMPDSPLRVGDIATVQCGSCSGSFNMVAGRGDKRCPHCGVPTVLEYQEAFSDGPLDLEEQARKCEHMTMLRIVDYQEDFQIRRQNPVDTLWPMHCISDMAPPLDY